jgi:hypothetical protein
MFWLAREIPSCLFGHISSDEESFKTSTIGVKAIKRFSSSLRQISWNVGPCQ